MNSNELKHYGVPGMKWGVRKEQYKQLGKKQKKVLRSYGTYYSGRAIKLRDKRAAGKLGEVKTRELKNIEKMKKNIERALKVKIDDVSASSNGKISRFIFGGAGPSLIMGASLSGATGAITSGKDALQKYLES